VWARWTIESSSSSIRIDRTGRTRIARRSQTRVVVGGPSCPSCLRCYDDEAFIDVVAILMKTRASRLGIRNYDDIAPPKALDGFGSRIMWWL